MCLILLTFAAFRTILARVFPDIVIAVVAFPPSQSLWTVWYIAVILGVSRGWPIRDLWTNRGLASAVRWGSCWWGCLLCWSCLSVRWVWRHAVCAYLIIIRLSMDFNTIHRQLLRRSKISRQELLNHPRLNPPRIRPVLERVAHADNPLKTPYRPLSTEDWRRIVFWRFGSMTDFTRIQRTVKEISMKLRIPWTTVKFTLANFLARGY